jgi:tetratricopeptide (TPR) repeat protein
MSNKDRIDNPSDFQDWLKRVWAPIVSLIGTITIIVQFTQLWRGDRAIVTLVFALVGGVLVLAGLSWVGFSKKSFEVPDFANVGKKLVKQEWRYLHGYLWARIGLAFVLIFCSVGIYFLYLHQKELNEKVIILVAKFDGPEETYGITNELIEQLRTSVEDYADIQVIPLEITIDTNMGREFAQKIGDRYLADIVIWGWYRPTENPNLTLHIENLDNKTIDVFDKSTNLKPTATSADLQSFSLQQKLGQEMSGLVLIVSGYAHFRSGDNQGALSRYEKAVAQNPSAAKFIKSTDFYFLLGNAHLDANDDTQAISDFSQVLALDPSSVTAYLNRGVAFSKTGQKEKAIEEYTQAIKINPNYISAYINRGATYGELGMYDLELADTNTAIELDPTSASAYNNRGCVYSELGNYTNALLDFNKAIQLDPKSITPYMNRGNIYSEIGQNENAIKDYSQVIKIDPNLISAYLNRGNRYSELGQKEKAIEDYTQAIKIDPNYSFAYLNRGNRYSELGQKEKAIEDYTQAIMIDPKYADAYFNRAYVYDGLGQNDKAIEDYSEVIRLATDTDSISYAKERIKKLTKP